MVDSERKTNYEQNTGDNVSYFIAAESTEASVPSPSNIIVSKEKLRGKDKTKLLLTFYDDGKILDDIVLARRQRQWEKKLNGCYASY